MLLGLYSEFSIHKTAGFLKITIYKLFTKKPALSPRRFAVGHITNHQEAKNLEKKGGVPMNTITFGGLVIDNHCFGNTMLLNRITPYYVYENDQKTNKICGYKYSVVLPGRNFQTLDVKIAGDRPLIQIPAHVDFVSVKFTDLEAKLYYDNNHRIQVSAKAAGIRLDEGSDKKL